MRRRFRFVAMLLVLGVVLNVLIAWSAVVLGCSDPGHVFTSGESGDQWFEVRRNVGVGHDALTVRTWVDTTGWPGRYFGKIPPEECVVGRSVSAGWPLFALIATRPEAGALGRDPRARQRGLLWERGQGSVLLPLQPIWLGFVVNSLLYASVGGLLLRGPRAVRAYVRRRRHASSLRCRRCGYPRGESSICSECGAAVKPLVTSAPPHASPPSS